MKKNTVNLAKQGKNIVNLTKQEKEKRSEKNRGKKKNPSSFFLRI